MDLPQALRIAFQITIFVTVLAAGLSTTTEDLAYLRRRPALLARSLLLTMIATPVIAIALCRASSVGTAAAIAIVAAALAPGLPTLPRAGRTSGGNVAFASSLLFVTSLLGVVTIPLWLELLRRFMGIQVSVSPWAIAFLLGRGLLAPLVLGVAIRRFAPTFATRLERPVSAASSALLPGLVLVVLLVGSSALLALPWTALGAMVVMPVIALALGHALGGPDPRDRTVLAIANEGRFPALAALIAATSFPQVGALPTVLAYAIVAQLVTVPYVRARKRAQSASREQPAPAGPPPGVIVTPA